MCTAKVHKINVSFAAFAQRVTNSQLAIRLLIEHSHTIFQAAQWYSVSRGQSLSGTSWPVGSLFSGTGQGGDGKSYQIKVRGKFGGLGLTDATGSSSTTIRNSSATWPADGFKGQQVAIVAGTGQWGILRHHVEWQFGDPCVGGWVTNYYQLTIVNPDSSSNFVVESNWPSHPTTSGTVTFVPYEFNGIEGSVGNGINEGELYAVTGHSGPVFSRTES